MRLLPVPLQTPAHPLLAVCPGLLCWLKAPPHLPFFLLSWSIMPGYMQSASSSMQAQQRVGRKQWHVKAEAGQQAVAFMH